ncbi:hypothetical protein MLD38_014815 [Melastoma candidum]|uniref:Uncharacterized protein n=1 Tax=Melastoma candidum TaxID=119954 RepID=A0ACB9RFC4_9MYRT|nr:hypothetical protein MLD38_014815 [Melastoma candidum]
MAKEYDSNHDNTSSCSSTRNPLADLPSFGSRCSSSSSLDASKPHMSNQPAWQAISDLRSVKGRLGLDHFRLLRHLGGGDIGNVYLCQLRNQPSPHTDPDPTLYAMKVVDTDALANRKKLGRAETEKEILATLDHPFLPTLYAEFDTSHYSCLVMEFCPGGDLYAARLRQPRKRFSISAARFYAAEIVLALEYLHMMGIVYRDLKPENVLVRDDGHIMLSDFDLSLRCNVVPQLLTLDPPVLRQRSPDNSRSQLTCASPLHPIISCFTPGKKHRPGTITTTTITVQADDNCHHDHRHRDGRRRLDPDLVAEPVGLRSRSFVGTHEYLAPEVITGGGHGSAVDWWALGVFVYEMVHGTTPFKDENNRTTLVNVLKKPLTFPRIGVSDRKEYEEVAKLRDLISRLLVKDPRKRIGSRKGAAEIKRHGFFAGVNWALIRSARPPEVPRASKLKDRGESCRQVVKKQRESLVGSNYQTNQPFDYF